MKTWYDLAEPAAAQLDRKFYDKVRAARFQYKLVERIVVPPYTGRGFVVTKGRTFRVIEETGPQIGSVAFWNAHNPNESFMAARTMSGEAFFVRPYKRLWSDLPLYRPLITCIEDTVITQPVDSEYHHHLVGTHCSSEVMEMQFGVAGLNNCRSNLLQAIQPFGLSEEHLHDSINVHQKAYLDRWTGRILCIPNDGKRGDYIEFYAEMDVLVAVSVCPFGDGSANPTMKGEGVVRPLGVEIYDTGIEPKPFPSWTNWRPTWTGRWLPPRS